ncbi:DUF3275 family protein [Suttonella ornithocola]|uniref:Protein of uncharacterized function (DUF3275) n=1 Tax=Suttonella ornithocola TaxID=279832 RepID=A0A380MVZ9_9GAMM|nr:DUF3275 family protein [Suttonella ornithocola]SUO96735.1 Protein of uncharacterised function (DUF3275) [Suttonella ornithocola]
MNTETFTIYGTLVIHYVNGRNGLFPIGTLKSAVGTFRVRSKWIANLEDGEYKGQFAISEFSLYSYHVYGENRTTIGILIDEYWLDDAALGKQAEPEILPDPVEEEGRNTQPVIEPEPAKLETIEAVSEQTKVDLEQDETNEEGYTPVSVNGVVVAMTRHSNIDVAPQQNIQNNPPVSSSSTAEAEIDQEKVDFLSSFDAEWTYGRPYKVDTTLSRQDIRDCRVALMSLGYRFDALKQVYVGGDS